MTQSGRRVSTFTAGCLLVSNMIGTGIFGTTGFMVADLGDPRWILLLWAAGGLFALLGASCYAELGAAMPRAGGEYVYLRAAFGPLYGFLTGWASLTIGFGAAIAANALLFGDHLRELLPFLLPQGPGSWQVALMRGRVLELAMVWSLTAVHVAGLGPGGFIQRLLTVVKVGALVALVAAGLALGTGDWTRLAQTDLEVSFGFNTLLVSFMFVTFSYSGWNAATYIANEIEDPERNLPRAMIWGTLTVGILYLSLNVVYLFALSISELTADPIALVGHKAAHALFGSRAGSWFTALLTVSILGASSAMIWAGPRVCYAMALDGVFPRFFGDTSARGRVPARSICLQSIWASVLIMTGTFEAVVLYATFVLIFFAALAVGAVIVMRRKRPDLERPYRTWTYPWVPLSYLAISVLILWAALELRPVESLWGVATVLAGIPFYLWWRRSDTASGGGG